MVDWPHIGTIKHEHDCLLHGSLATQRKNPLSSCRAIGPARFPPVEWLDVNECDVYVLHSSAPCNPSALYN